MRTLALAFAGLIVATGQCAPVMGPAWAASDRPTRLRDRLVAAETDCNDPCSPANTVNPLTPKILDLAAQLRGELSGAHDAAATVERLNHFIFVTLGIAPSRDILDPANLLLSEVIGRRRGYCVGIASLYLVLAEELDLPVHAVAAPSHLFLRYDDGHSRLNIETFEMGRDIPDSQYARDMNIPESSIRRGIFLEDLSADRFLAQVQNNLGVIESSRKAYDSAKRHYLEALALDRRLPSALYNLGNDALAQDDLEGAVRAYTRSLRLYPDDAWALNNRGLAYRRLGVSGKARRDFERALETDPAFEAARKNLAASP